MPLLAILILLCGSSLPGQETRFDEDSRTMGLVGAWGHSWDGGWPGFGRTESDIAFGAFHPQMGWFVSDHLEIYGEGTLLVYHKPEADIAGGLLGLAGRYHFWNTRSWTPYFTLGGGLLWTSQQQIEEIDRIFNFQVVVGAGIRFVPRSGPGWIVEFRNHHISNAGTAGRNLGINAATVVGGVQWVLR